MNRITKPSEDCLNLIKLFEGLKLKSYLCPAGVPTIGYGTTLYPNGKRVRLNESISVEEANDYLLIEVNKFAKSVDALTRDDLTQYQFDALTSFAYNLGANNLKNSTLLKKVNLNPNDPSIHTEFLKWVKGGGRVLKGLVNRRKAEANLYFKK
jgi:lysozyme